MRALLDHPASTAATNVGQSTAVSPILLATDGTTRADGAVRAAALLAATDSPMVNVVSVLEPLPVVSPEGQIAITRDMTMARHDDRLLQIREQLTRVLGGERAWSVDVCEGSPAGTVLEQIEETGSQLAIVGLGRHRVIDRLFNGETALQLLRVSHIPVLAVPQGFASRPRNVIVAMDFSDLSLRAAKLATELVEADGTVYLAHVITRDVQTGLWETWYDEYAKALVINFEQVKQQLALPPTLTLETITLCGDPAHEILELAHAVDADLIATGSHGHGFFSRMLLGSVATKLIRGATCAVLGVPRPAAEGVEDDGLHAGERASGAVSRVVVPG